MEENGERDTMMSDFLKTHALTLGDAVEEYLCGRMASKEGMEPEFEEALYATCMVSEVYAIGQAIHWKAQRLSIKFPVS